MNAEGKTDLAARVLHNYAQMYVEAPKLMSKEEAEKLHQEALRIRRDMYEHSVMCTTMRGDPSSGC